MNSLSGIQYQPVLDAIDMALIREEISKSKQNDDLKAVLTGMALDEGLSCEDAAGMADQVMEKVLVFEKMQIAVNRDPRETVAALLAAMDALDPELRLVLTEELDREIGLITEDGEAVSDHPEDPSVQTNEEESTDRLPGREAFLRRRIADRAARISLSPEYLERIIGELSGCSHTVTYEALGESGYLLKCVTAMYLNLRDFPNTEEKLSRNVFFACTAAEMEAVGDAVGRGLKTEKRVYNLLGFLILTAVVVSFFFLTIHLQAGVPFSRGMLKAAAVRLRPFGMFISTLSAAAYGSTAAVPLLSLLDGCLRKGANSLTRYGSIIRGLINSGSETVTLGLTRLARYASFRDDPAADREMEDSEEDDDFFISPVISYY